ncbi:MAG: glycosyltransferase family 2 protein, partial [Vicinamibacteria bacterium]
FRTGADGIMEVDTVPFGCYRREVFERIGAFDPELIRNQDDELNARLLRAGGKILLVPDVVIIYFARPTLLKLTSMFYQYGLFKPLSVKKAGGAVTWRQFAPPLFVLGNIGGLALGFASPLFWWFILGANGLHFIVGSLMGMKKAMEGGSVKLPLLLPIVFYAMHWAYGWGYLAGVFRFLLLGRRPDPARIELSR